MPEEWRRTQRRLRALALSAASWLILAPPAQAQEAEQSSPTEAASKPPAPPAIVVGLVGGYVRRDNAVHSVVQLARRLQQDYPKESEVRVMVYENHHGKDAEREILTVLHAGHHGTPTEEEKRGARIVIFGHSWGASETVTLARSLGQQGIPVLLTVQVDSVAKRNQDDGTIPANVAEAANFYQLDGLLHGRQEIRAQNPAATHIVGNFQSQYKTHPLTCTSPYPWYNRVFMRPHTEIECDPNVWDKVEKLIRSKLPSKANAVAAN